jgi:putative oxidoreductase
MNRLISGLIDLFSRIPHSVLALLGRFAVGLVFWRSGQTKLEGYQFCFPGTSCFKANPFSLGENTFVLFENEYHVPLLPSWLAAHGASLAEFVLPVLLFIGLGTRFAALGLLAMTLVIQIFVYPGAYVLHGTWAAILIMLLKFGPGKIALDHLIWKR